MANSLFSSFTIASILIVLLSISPATGDEVFGARVDRKLLGLKKEKLSHFKFYWHDILSGPTPTSMRVISPPSNESTTLFGLVNMMDNPLTLGPKLSSKVVGKAQGLYASASQKDLGLLMIMNFAFIEGKYNGSTLAVLGRNEVMSEVREMPVIGGSGLFRFSRGYVQAKTHTVEWKTGDAIVEYNVYVLHY